MRRVGELDESFSPTSLTVPKLERSCTARLYLHGRLLRSSLRTTDGAKIPGLRDLLEQLRRRRAELLAEGVPEERMGRMA